jgi:hypothetical protein
MASLTCRIAYMARSRIILLFFHVNIFMLPNSTLCQKSVGVTIKKPVIFGSITEYIRKCLFLPNIFENNSAYNELTKVSKSFKNINRPASKIHIKKIILFLHFFNFFTKMVGYFRIAF